MYNPDDAMNKAFATQKILEEKPIELIFWKQDFKTREKTRLCSLVVKRKKLKSQYHVIMYIKAKLLIKHKAEILTSIYTNETISQEVSLKIEITTCKRMITKINTALRNEEKKQEKMLIAYFDERYHNTVKKLKWYEKRLKSAKNGIILKQKNKNNVKN